MIAVQFRLVAQILSRLQHCVDADGIAADQGMSGVFKYIIARLGCFFNIAQLTLFQMLADIDQAPDPKCPWLSKSDGVGISGGVGYGGAAGNGA